MASENVGYCDTERVVESIVRFGKIIAVYDWWSKVGDR